jgi:LysR family transcriptional regulator, regulator of abg operon
MKLNQLRDAAAIAEHGSLRAAARALRLAQPALTRSVRELEHELGAPLFERRTKGMVLTAVGEAFVQRARAILSDVERARVEVDQIVGGVGGSLVAGLSIAAHILLLPRSLQRFNKRYPGVHLRIIEGFFPTLIGGLRDGSVDFYIGPRPSGHLPEGLVIEKLFDNDRQIVCRAGHPLMPMQFTQFSLVKKAIVAIPVIEKLPAPPMVLVRRAGFSLTPAADYFVELLRNRPTPA